MQVFSPSDFGFHNALLKDNGKLCFLDFEYFGRDDPVKLMADFIWHHYACTSRSDTSFWKHYAELDGKTTLLQRIQNNTNLKQNLYPSYVYAYLAIYYGIPNDKKKVDK